MYGRDEAQQLRDELTAKGEAIANDTERIPEVRQKELDALWNEYAPRIRAAANRHVEERDAISRKAVQDIAMPLDRSPERMAAYRDALDRARNAKNLRALLDEAELTGDEDQARAVFTIAHQRQDNITMENYLNARPTQKALWESHARSQREQGFRTMFEEGAMYHVPGKPQLRTDHEAVTQERKNREAKQAFTRMFQ